MSFNEYVSNKLCNVHTGTVIVFFSPPSFSISLSILITCRLSKHSVKPDKELELPSTIVNSASPLKSEMHTLEPIQFLFHFNFSYWLGLGSIHKPLHCLFCSKNKELDKYGSPIIMTLSEKELKTNIDLNVKISMQMLRKWYSIHHDWTLALGAYNSGSPIRNGYAVYATSNKDYKNNWKKL